LRPSERASLALVYRVVRVHVQAQQRARLQPAVELRLEQARHALLISACGIRSSKNLFQKRLFGSGRSSSGGRIVCGVHRDLTGLSELRRWVVGGERKVCGKCAGIEGVAARVRALEVFGGVGQHQSVWERIEAEGVVVVPVNGACHLSAAHKRPVRREHQKNNGSEKRVVVRYHRDWTQVRLIDDGFDEAMFQR
jgi:hypothetical protein